MHSANDLRQAAELTVSKVTIRCSVATGKHAKTVVNICFSSSNEMLLGLARACKPPSNADNCFQLLSEPELQSKRKASQHVHEQGYDTCWME